MSEVIRICDENGNKRSGFEISKPQIIQNLFPSEIRIGTTFKIGKYKYEVCDIFFHQVRYNDTYKGLTRTTLDNETIFISSHIWFSCITKDPRIIEGNITLENQTSLAKDLNITNPSFQ